MKVRAIGTGFDLTKGKVYEVIHEYETVYELVCDTGRYCRAKEFFEVVDDSEEAVDMPGLLECIDSTFNQDVPCQVILYNTVTGVTDTHVKMRCWLAKNIGGTENFIEISWDRRNELTVYERELELVFFRENVAVVKYGELIIICSASAEAYVKKYCMRAVNEESEA